MSRKLGVLGGVHVYREPFLLPTENLPVGLGDTRRHSESKGLQRSAETSRDSGVTQGSAVTGGSLTEDLWLGYLHGMQMVTLRQGICWANIPSIHPSFLSSQSLQVS